MSYILHLNAAVNTLPALVGGKAQSLAKLVSARIPVPDCSVLTTEAFRLFLSENNFSQQVRDILSRADMSNPGDFLHVSKRVERLIVQADLPHVIKDEIEALETSLQYPVVVRSSSSVEDGEASSWAGQHKTVLGVEKNELTSAITQCWASLYSPSALMYAQQNNFDIMKTSMGVVIQHMVQSDVSGACFTRSPGSGKENEMLVEAVYGLGEGLVDGLYTPDRYRIIASTEGLDVQIEEVRISPQTQKMTWNEGKVREISVQEETVHMQKLSKEQITALVGLARRAERVFGHSCDIEWAVEKGKLFLLQCRGITGE